MKYTYRDKKTYKLKNKLKLLLTILLAALISTTGYILSKNAFADTSPYGTATVTYNTGTDGQFADGTTTNTVTYNLRKVTTKYSHTPNVEDNGKLIKDYWTNMDTNEVITMLGANTLTVDVYYGGYMSTDWLSIWIGSHPNYTAASNYNSTGYVTTAMGAPNNDNKFCGSQSGNYIVNGIPISKVGHFTLTIPGDSVTFGFKSNSSYTRGYGYYAIVTANENEVTPTIDDVSSGEYKEPIENSSTGIFDGWGTDITTITGNTSVSAVYSSPKYSGTYDGVSWSIRNGKLFIGQDNSTQTFTYRSSRSSNSYPWYQYSNGVTLVRFFGTVNGNGSMSYMFYNMREIKYFDFTNFNTTNVTSMAYMFWCCEALMSLDLTPFNTSNVTDMSYMFDYCHSLTSLDLTSLITTNVTNMSCMFAGCSDLTSLDLTSLNTSNVTNMNNMFERCSGLTSLDLSPLDTSDVTNMAYMFRACSSITSFDLSPLDTSSVTDMQFIFSECSSITSFDLSPLNTSSVTDMSGMFFECSGLTGLNLAPLNTNNVTNMSTMFTRCRALISLNLTPLNTSNVTNMSGMFNGCSSLTNLNLTSLNTSSVTNMGSMFRDCSSLTSLNLTSFNTNNVTKMNNMFSGCSGLITLNLTPLNTSNVTNMSAMFLNCSGLTSLNLTPLNTSNVIDMTSMFEGCSSLINLNLTSLDTSKVMNMGNMFSRCIKLQEINLSNFNSSSIRTDASYYTFDVFYSLPKLNKLILGPNFIMTNYMGLVDSWTKQDTFTTYSADYLMNNYDGSTMSGTYLRNKQSTYYALLYENGDLVFQIGTTPESGKGNVIGTYTDYIKTDYNNYVDVPWYTNRTLVKRVVFRDLIAPDSTSYWFYGMTNLESISGMDANFDASNVYFATSMFEDCTKLKTLDFGNLIHPFPCVNNIASMFKGCTSLKTLDISSFMVGIYSYTTNALYNTPSLCELTLGEDWAVTYNIGLGGQWIRDGDTKVWDAVSLMNEYDAWYMAGTYRWPAAYAILYDTGEMVFQRGNTPDPTKGNVVGIYTGFETATYDRASTAPWDLKRSSVRAVNFKDVIMPVSTAYWFSAMGNLTTINNIEKLNTSDVVKMNYMFHACVALTSLDVSSFDTSNVTDMSLMFYNCSSLTSLDLSNFDTSSVTNMSSIFSGCRNLVSLDISNFDTSSVTKMTSMFSKCRNITSLDLSNFDASSVTWIWMDSMFSECNSLISLDLSGFNVSNVTKMKEMFYNCSSLTSLDLSNFDTSSVTNMSSIFSGCGNLVSLDISNFDTSSVNSMNNMFCGCNSLTSLDVSNFDTSNVSDMGGMFQSCSSLTTLDLSSFDTSSVNSMYYMFYLCSNLTSLDVSNFDTSNVANMGGMFQSCSSLTTLDLSDFNTNNVMNMDYMFCSCSNLMSLDLSSFDTSYVENMNYMFCDCDNLTTLDLSDFNTGNVIYMVNMFADCDNLRSLDISSFDTSNVYEMNFILFETDSLNELKLGNNFAFSNDQPIGLTKQWLRDGTSTVYTAEQLTSSYDGSTMAGTYIAVKTLTITEEVRGTLADVNQEFDFLIYVTSNDAPINYTLPYFGSKTGNLSFNGLGIAPFYLKHGETIDIYLPSDCYYNISQATQGYTLSQTNKSGTLNVDKTATFIDILYGTTPTGIFVDLIPYIIMLLLGIGSLVFIKKLKV